MKLPRPTVRLRLTLGYGLLFLVSGIALLAIVYVLVRDSPIVSVTGPVQITPGPLLGGVPTPDPAQLMPPPELQQQLIHIAQAQHQQMVNGFLRDAGIALAVMLVVSMGLSWLLAGRMLRPLRRLTDDVQTISHTNLDTRLRADGPDDEIHELSDTFDELLDRLESSFEAQKRFVANASHELRTPLARQRVIGEVTLADPAPTMESLREAHEAILATGAEQERTLESLLLLARGQRRLEHLERCDLATIAEAVIDRAETDLSVSTTLDLSAAAALGSPVLLERLVTNLIDNAYAHNVEGGQVTVATGTRDGHAVLSVTNTGQVIRPDQVSRILEPFRQLDSDRTSPRRGLGLGLSIVAAIAETHGAQLSVAPREGGGLVVEVLFPG